MTDRKLFEAWASKQTQWDLFWSDNFQSYMDHQTNAAWLAWQASSNIQGYKLIPIEPSKDALLLMCDEVADCTDINEMYRAYKAMIGAVE